VKMIWQIILSIIGTIATVVYIIIKVKTNKDVQKLDVTANQPLCFNMPRRAFTEGYNLGVVKSQLPRKNGTTLFEFYPIDVEQGESVPRPHLQSVVVKNEYIKSLGRGETGSRRELIFLTGRNPLDYPEKMRDTTEGKWMTKEGQLGFMKSLLGDAIPNSSEAMTAIMKEFHGGEMSATEFAKIKQTAQKYREMQGVQEQPTQSGSQDNKK